MGGRMSTFIGYLPAIVIIGMGLLLIGVILRFSIISSFRTRGSKRFIRKPDLDAAASVCGFPPPADLGQLYRNAPFIERMEFDLVDESKTPPKRWTIGSFKPLTRSVVREWRAISGVPGIPIADDMDKGTYFVDNTGAVVLCSPNIKESKALVALTVREFMAFEARECSEE
jgi:hypothetical protein